VEHPAGEFSVELQLDPTKTGAERLAGCALLRTARLIFEGRVAIPASVWDGHQDDQQGSHHE
jgi:4-oxalomesaconate tautomerase